MTLDLHWPGTRACACHPIYDDGCTARELNRDETWMLESVARILGYDGDAVEG